MKYITYFDCWANAWHIKQIDESKIKQTGVTSFAYYGMIYNSPLYNTREEARKMLKTSKKVIED